MTAHRRLRRLATSTAAALGLATAITMTSAGPAAATYPGGKNGRLAFGMSVDGNVDIYSASPDGLRVRRLTTGSTFDACAAYSADGRQIAYCSGGPDLYEVWTMRANGSHQRQLTHLGGSALFPDFSPDGTQVAFSGHWAGETIDQIFVIDTDGTHLRQLTLGTADNDYPAWSPDGRTIAFTSDRTGMSQVYVMNARGGQQTQLTFDPNPHGQLPDWSPDGTRIAYEDDGYGGGDIMVMNADGSNQHDVSNNPDLEFGAAWSPDGTQIAFARLTADGRPVVVMNADGSGQHNLIGGANSQFVPAWQPRQVDDDWN